MRALTVTTLDDRAEALRHRILGPGGFAPPPFWVWAQNIALAENVEPLGDHCRNRTVLPAGVWELVVLVVARHNRSPFAWYAHYDDAIDAGTPKECLDRLASGAEPAFHDAALDLAYRVMTSILVEHGLSEALFTEVTDAWGQAGLVDLVGCMGSFSLSAWGLNVFRVGFEQDARPWPFLDTPVPVE